MRLRSSIRKASRNVKCSHDAHIKSKSNAVSGDASRETKSIVPPPSSAVSRTSPSISKNVPTNKRSKKGKQTPFTPQDPYLFVDDDSDENKENIDPYNKKCLTVKCDTKKTHLLVKAKVANSKKLKSKQWPPPTPFTVPYIPSRESNGAQYKVDLHTNTPKSIITAIPLVSKTVSPEVTSTLHKPNLLISPDDPTKTHLVNNKTEGKSVSFSLPEYVRDSPCHVVNCVSNTPDHLKNISTHNLEESISGFSKIPLSTLNPQIASTPAISDDNSALQISMGCRVLIPTPINCTFGKRNKNSQIPNDHLQEDSLFSPNILSDTTDKRSSSKDSSKESTSSSGRRHRKLSESERQVSKFIFYCFISRYCVTNLKMTWIRGY
ncbi:hypothetical protein EWB00_004331 [Schistosoma japonicum]|uniref:Uncharacterized protein n=1 Tax=Schistosoma japonicum TaxID=6182 RepID=A0A4Z2D5U4_SCHJA|nr:hypothetical protein EWB00_004331 [Schistosoma japonicum]